MWVSARATPYCSTFFSRRYFCLHFRLLPPLIQDLPVPSVQFADDICNFATTLEDLCESLRCTLQYCHANRLWVNMHKACYTIFNAPSSTHHPDLAVTGQLLRYESKPCYLGVCLSDNKAGWQIRSYRNLLYPILPTAHWGYLEKIHLPSLLAKWIYPGPSCPCWVWFLPYLRSWHLPFGKICVLH